MASKQFNSVDGYSTGNPGSTINVIDAAGNITASGSITRNSRNVPTVVHQANTPPSSPLEGDQWYNTTTGVLFEYLNDGTSSQWVDVNGLPGVVGPIVLPGGTANAVVYLNSSGETVTSSSLVFNGTNVTAPSFTSTIATGTAPFTVSSTTQVANLNAATAGTATTATSATTAGTVTTAAQGNITSVGTLTGLTVSGSANLATSSGNVGIGTSSPGFKLEVTGDIRLGSGGDLRLGSATGTTTSAGDSSIFNDASDLYFNTGNVNRMYIANGGNVGIGTAGPGYRLDIASADTTPGLGYAFRIRANATAAAGAIQFTDSGVTTQWGHIAATATSVTLDASGSSVLAFRTNSDERMRITSSGNVGIGITTPAAKLEIMQNQAAFSYLDYYNTTVGGGIVWRQIVRNIANTGTTSVDLAKIGTGFLINNNDTNAANFTAFGVGASERMRITSDGNVGIGTSSPGTYNLNVAGSLRAGDTIDFGNAGTNPSIINVGIGATGNRFAIIDFIGDTTYTDYGFRVGRYNNGANGTSELQHRGTGALSLNAFDAGVILMQTQNIERMRITSGGEVGIGTTAPTYKLEVYGSPAWIRNFAGTPSSPTETQDWPVAAFNIASFGNYSDQTMLAFTLPNDGNYFLGYDAWNFKLDQTANSTTSAGVNGMRFGGPGYLAFMPGTSEKARIDSSGNVLIGTTGLAYGFAGRTVLAIDGTDSSLIEMRSGGTARGYIIADANVIKVAAAGTNALLFETNVTERARIDSSGAFMVGTTNPDPIAAEVNGVTFNPTNGYSILANKVNSAAIAFGRTGNTGAIVDFYYGVAPTSVGFISTDGTNTAYNTSSDYRLKEIDGPVANSGAYIDALKPVQGSWRADGSRFIGLLAHEVQEVSETQIATGDKDGEKMQAMDYSAPELIANLIAEIQSLRARVAQLEGK